MSKINLVRTSAFDRNDFFSCIDTLIQDDIVVLIDDGCYNVSHPSFKDLHEKLDGQNIFVIEHHYQARAIYSSEQLQFIKMDTLVDLIAKATSCITWQ